jgi:trigger factor
LKVDYVEETSVRKSLTFEIEAELLDQEVETRAREYARKLKLPGFRPGKVPLGVVKGRYQSELLQEAVEALVNRVVPEEIRGRGLAPVAPPEVVDVKAQAGAPLTFRAVVETLPFFDLPEYRGLAFDARTPQVSDSDVDKELQQLHEASARYESVEPRPVQRGDFAEVDLVWREREGDSEQRREGALLHVDEADNNPEMVAALVGMSAGETRGVRVSYPADASVDLAGKTVDYRVALRAVKLRKLPTLDDEFAKDVGDFEGLDALRVNIRTRLEEREAQAIEREINEGLVDALIQSSSFEVPEAMVERHMTARTENAARSLALRGVDPSKAGVDWRKFRDAQREASLRAARAEILLDEIARREGLEVTPAEVEAEIARLAERMRSRKEVLRKRMEQDGDVAALRARMRTDKTLDLLRANARLNRG